MTDRAPCESPRCRAHGQHAPGCTDGDCRGCLPRLAADGLRLCHVCRRRLAEDITTAAQLHGELALVLASVGIGGERVSGSPTRSLALNDAAVDARTLIRHTLVSWAQLVAEERGFSLPADHVTAIAAYLVRDVEWLAAHETARDCADEFAELAHGRPRRIAYPNGARTFTVARCPEDGCGGEIRAVLRRTDALLPSELVCGVDGGHRWTAGQWIRLGRRLMEAA